MTSLNPHSPGGKASGAIERKQAIDKYYLNPNYCLFCEKIIEIQENKKPSATRKKKFCSHSCAASFNNKGINRHEENYGEVSCLKCGKIFTRTNHKEECCSKRCFVDYRRDRIIENFLNGESNDRQVRNKIVKKYIIEKQNGLCALCNCLPFHNGKPLVFIIDHIDGNFANNNPKNIRAICPNCNSQTDTFAGKNVGKNKTSRYNKQTPKQF